MLRRCFLLTAESERQREMFGGYVTCPISYECVILGQEMMHMSRFCASLSCESSNVQIISCKFFNDVLYVEHGKI